MAKYSECDIHRGGPKDPSCPKCMSVIDDSFSPGVQGEQPAECAPKLDGPNPFEIGEKALRMKKMLESLAQLGEEPMDTLERVIWEREEVLAKADPDGLAIKLEATQRELKNYMNYAKAMEDQLKTLSDGGRVLVVKAPPSYEFGRTVEHRMVIGKDTRYLIVHKLDHLDRHAMGEIHEEFSRKFGAENVVSLFIQPGTEITVLELPQGA